MKLYELDLIPHKKKQLEKQELFITLILKNVSFLGFKSVKGW